MTNYPRFGESFTTADTTNRLDIRQETALLPSYVRASLEVRAALKDSIRQASEWPSLPATITSVDDFISSAKQAVATRWKVHAQPIINRMRHSWIEELSAMKDETMEDNQSAELEKLITLFNNSNDMETGLFIQQLRSYESLRTFLPEAWRTIVLLSSERQHGVLTLLRHWTTELMQDPQQVTAFEQKTQTKIAEVQLFFDISGVLGKYFDHAYLKQEEIAGLPGGSSGQSPLEALREDPEAKGGLTHVYDRYLKPESNEHEISTYNDMFPAEWPRIVSRLDALATRVETQVRTGMLPETYEPLPAYLRLLAKAYGSDDTNPQTLQKLHDEDLANAALELQKVGCPLSLIRMCFPHMTRDSKKADIEVRVIFRNHEMQQMEEQWTRPFRDVAQRYVDSHKGAFEKEYTVPSQFPNLQIAYGYNNYWSTRGDAADPTIIYTHVNAVADSAQQNELPRLRAIFPECAAITESDYRSASIRGTVAHEFGHMLANRHDASVRARVGDDSFTETLDEMKADMGGAKIIGTAKEEGTITAKELQMHVYAMIGDACSYLSMPESNIYHPLGVMLIDTLLEIGVIVEDNNAYTIVQPERAIPAFTQLADTILQNYYFGTEVQPSDAQVFVQDQMKRKSNPLMRKFLQYMRTKMTQNSQ